MGTKELDWEYLEPRTTFAPREAVLELCVALAKFVPGNIMEFGVADGGSTRTIRAALGKSDKQIFACDSFEGLQEEYENAKIGDFACEPPVIPGVEIVKGFFENSLTPELARRVGRVAMASLDADLYSSTICVLRWLTPLLGSGSLLVFDEFLGEKESEKRAFEEWQAETGMKTVLIADFLRNPSGWGTDVDKRPIYQVVQAETLPPPPPPAKTTKEKILDIPGARAALKARNAILGEALMDFRSYILNQIAAAPVQTAPYPHIVITEIFPPEFYRELQEKMPPPSQFAAAEYPGTGHGKVKRQAPGLAYPDMGKHPMFAEIKEFLEGEEFSRALLGKFSRPDGIPAEKHKFFANGAREFTPVFDLQIDRRGYEILPHADIHSKIITFQFYLVADASLKRFGTLFCKTKDGKTAKRGMIASAIGDALEGLARALGNRPEPLWYWLERTTLGTEIGFRTKGWYPWRMFDIIADAPALPNHFMAFAPNEKSYHAVRMDIPEDSIGRTVIRGFIRSGANTSNYIELKSNAKAAAPR